MAAGGSPSEVMRSAKGKEVVALQAPSCTHLPDSLLWLNRLESGGLTLKLCMQHGSISFGSAEERPKGLAQCTRSAFQPRRLSRMAMGSKLYLSRRSQGRPRPTVSEHCEQVVPKCRHCATSKCLQVAACRCLLPSERQSIAKSLGWLRVTLLGVDETDKG